VDLLHALGAALLVPNADTKARARVLPKLVRVIGLRCRSEDLECVGATTARGRPMSLDIGKGSRSEGTAERIAMLA
jgi:hypothetical protein